MDSLWSIADRLIEILMLAVTAWAAMSASRAAKIALEIDNRAQRRAEQRERRDALPMAGSLIREMEHLELISHDIIERCRIFDDVIEMMCRIIPQLSCPLLEAWIERLGTFDEETSEALGTCAECVSRIRAWKKQWADNPGFSTTMLKLEITEDLADHAARLHSAAKTCAHRLRIFVAQGQTADLNIHATPRCD